MIPESDGSKSERLCPTESIVAINSSGSSELKLFMIHPIEGHVGNLQTLAAQLNATVYGLQCSKDAPLSSIEDLAAHYINVCITKYITFTIATVHAAK